MLEEPLEPVPELEASSSGSPGARTPACGSWQHVTAAALIYTVLALIMVGQGLLPGRALSGSDYLWSHAPFRATAPPGVQAFGTNFELADAALVFEPFLLHTRASLPDVPLWNPHLMTGRPFLGNAQSAVFSPFSLPTYILPFWKSLAVVAFLKIVVAGLGTYLFGRAIGMRFAGAVVAGIVFSCGLFFVAWLAWPLSSVFALIPWSLLMTELLIRRPNVPTVAGLAGVTALQLFGGHPESNFHLLLATVAFFTARLVGFRERRSLRSHVRTLSAFVIALLAGAGLAAVTLLPFLELLLESNQVATRDEVQLRPTPGRYLLTLFLPAYWGRSTQTSTDAFIDAYFTDRALYAGGLTLLLAGAALFLRPRPASFLVAGSVALLLAVILGAEPIHGLINGLPLIGGLKHGRLVILVLVCLAVLAGWGLDELAEQWPTGRSGRSLLALCGVLVCLPVVWMTLRGDLGVGMAGRFGEAFRVGWLFGEPASHHFESSTKVSEIVRLASLMEWLVLAGAGVALIALRLRGRVGAHVFVVSMVALVAADLLKMGVGFNPALPASRLIQGTTPAIEYLRSRRPNRFVGITPRGFPFDPLPPDVAMRYGLYDARGYDYVVERRHDRLWSETVGSSPEGLPTRAPVNPTSLRTLSLLSVADLIQDPGDPPLRVPGLRLAYEGADARVYANEHALPRAFVVERQIVVPDAERAKEVVTERAFDGRRVAVTETSVPGLPRASVGGEPGGSARVVQYEDERVRIEATTPRPALLILTDNYYPGWKAAVDGREAQVHRVDYLLRGVRLPAGAHTVEFRYEPASWTLGLLVSGLALGSMIVVCVVWWYRHRGAPITDRVAAPGPPTVRGSG